MKRKIIVVAVGAFAAITGFTSSVRAQSTQEFTLSDESLDVENLTVRDDYNKFFGTSSDRENISLDSKNPNPNRDDGVWQISEQVELQVNEPIAPPVSPAFPQQEGASIVNDIDRAKLQYELLE